MKHVALVHRHYLDAILEGSKIVEIRLSSVRCAPFGCISVGDRIFFRQTAGEYRATARAACIEFFEDLTPTALRRLERRVRVHAGGRRDYWRRHQHARYASLIWLDQVRQTRSGPPLPRLFGRAWVVLDRGSQAR